jgi:hypothetical protein
MAAEPRFRQELDAGDIVRVFRSVSVSDLRLVERA